MCNIDNRGTCDICGKPVQVHERPWFDIDDRVYHLRCKMKEDIGYKVEVWNE